MKKKKLVVFFLLLSLSGFSQINNVAYFKKDVWFGDTVHYKNSFDSLRCFIYNHKFYFVSSLNIDSALFFTNNDTLVPLKTNLAGGGGGSGVQYSDTAAMLTPYLRSALAATTYATISNLALKLNISDTAAMLANYYNSRSDLPAMTATLGGAVPTPPNNTTTFLRGDGTFAAPSGGGDMILASVQTVTGVKTFNDTKLFLRNVANTFNGSFVNTNTADRIYTLKDASGTLAFTTDITGTNSGTNTGDNSVNSLYSGLVTNATHTGDATGSTALTVVKINGTLMSGLATGILKNTTATGVPSIAIAGDFPTLNQNTTGSAATLLPQRTINGNIFDNSNNITVPVNVTKDGTAATDKWPIVFVKDTNSVNTTAYTSPKVYLDPGAGKITATTFVGALIGNASSSTTSDAGALTGITLNAPVTQSSLITFGTSPSFTGTPTSPTAAAGTNTTQLATTAFVYTERENAGGINTKSEMQVLKNQGAASITTVGLLAAPTLTATTTTADSIDGKWMNHATTAIIGNASGVIAALFTIVRRDWETEYITTIRTDPTNTSVRYWMGLFSAAPDLIVRGIGTIHIAAFSYDTGIDGTAFWRTCTSGGGVNTFTTTTTTQSIQPNTKYIMRIVCSNTSNDIKFYINNTLVSTHSATLPTSTQLLGYGNRITTLTASIRNLKWGRIGIRTN